MVDFDEELDVKGLSCPMPVLKTKQKIKTMSSGQVLKIVTTDKGSKADIPAMSSRGGHEVIHSEEAGDVFTFYVKVG